MFLILIGLPTMIAGFTLGYRHDDLATMIGTIVVAVIILMVNIPALKR